MNRLIVTAAICGVALLSAGCTTTRGAKLDETAQLKNQVAALESQVGALNQRVEDLSQKQETLEIQQGPKPQGARRTILSATKIQTALKTAGYYAGPVDGKLGRQTREAIKEFQKANGLTADGVVGSKTSAALARVLGES